MVSETLYGGFLKQGYNQIINFNRIFHKINHPAIGVPPFMDLPIWLYYLGVISSH